MTPIEGNEVAVLKIGRLDEHFEIEYLSRKQAQNMVLNGLLTGWDVEQINFGFRIQLPDDEMWSHVDLIDRAAAAENMGVML